VLLWFPYVLAGAALLVAAGCRSDWKEAIASSWRKFDVKRGAVFVAVAAVAIVAVYGSALAARDITSAGEAKAWVAESQHGLAQTIRFLRIGTGLPRSFLYLGRDGVLYRRFLFHDPYAPVTLGDLVKASLWRIAFFDLFVVCLLYELWKHRPANWVLVMLALAAVPVVIFAVFLFEPGSPERYLPALPFLLASVAWVLRDAGSTRRFTQWMIAAFLVCVVLNNGYSFFRPLVSREDRISEQRVEGFRAGLPRGSAVVILTIQDPLDDVLNRSPFGKINQPRPLPVFDAIEDFSAERWQARLAARFEETWSDGGEVWISKRLWSTKPRPEWFWVEGEVPQISWPQIPRFANLLQTDADSGGEDGFVRLAANVPNRQLLADILARAPHAAPISEATKAVTNEQ